MFHRILVPVDTSSFATTALGPAVAIAKRSKGEVDFILVHEMSLLVPEGADIVDLSRRAEEADYVERVLAPLVGELARQGVRGETVLRDGPALDAIVAHAEVRQADLIVVASHGRTGIDRAFRGSMADELMRRVGCPILMIRPKGDIQPADRILAEEAFHRILVPLDGSLAAEAVLGEAEALARSTAATLILTRVVEPVPMIVSSVPMPEMMLGSMPDTDATATVVEDAEAYLENVAADLARDGHLTIETRVHIGHDVGAVLAGLTRRYGADLVAMTTHGRGASRLIVGSVEDKLLRGTDCAVLMHRQPPAMLSAFEGSSVEDLVGADAAH